ncbi:MAG: nucleotidyl transferase AbiEii/AbiGii toxin family protein [Candidatus Aegiribacteria sp.]|nr:nucleotidyl transferase AbiEii/AbiGii toxin family protein [Candidatus Aegiribacteria sp.]
MDGIALLPAGDRNDLFEETARKRDTTSAVIEKDFWVCLVLQKLFTSELLAGQLLFKGGTSLSKVFGLLERFSEDIDIVLDWKAIIDEDPNEKRSRKKQTRFIERLREESIKYIAEAILPELRTRVGHVCELELDEHHENVIRITYPSSFDSDYLRSEVQLEIGPVSLLVPSDTFTIQPYAADEFPELFSNPSCNVQVICAESTFWEKTTILHQEAFRPEDKPQPPGYSRHYYDMMRMADSEIKTRALADLGLLRTVVDFKNKFYPRAWARYDLAEQGTIRLLPSPHVETALRRDYREMQEMIYGERPSFDEILKALKILEEEINSLEGESND